MPIPLPSPKTCASCGGALHLSLAHVRDPMSRDHFQVKTCADCGLGTTDPVPLDLDAAYPASYHGKRHSFTSEFCARRRFRVLDSVSGGRPGRLLDYGAGDGAFLAYARRRNWQTFGIERSSVAEQLRRAGERVFDDEAEAMGEGPFDAITLFHVLEHLDKPGEVIRRLRSALREDGIMIVAVPNFEGVQAQLFGERWVHLDVPRHLFHFGPRALEKMLRSEGFRVEKWIHHELEYDLFGWIQSASNAFFEEPNILFSALTGREPRVGLLRRALAVGVGASLGPAAIAGTALSVLFRRGGTLVAIARRN